MKRWMLVWIGCWLLSAGVASASTLTDVRFNQTDDTTQLIFEADEKVVYHFFHLQNPDRLVIDFQKMALNTSALDHPFSGVGVERIRKNSSPEKLRVVVDLAPDTTDQVVLSEGDKGSDTRLVVTISKKSSSEVVLVEEQVSEAPLQKPVVHPGAVQPVNTVYRDFQDMRDVIVVIDPGHGGKDPGSIGRQGTQEKRVVLEISQRLCNLINKETGFKATLTRNKDYYLPLRQRLAIARKDRADMFIAVHADAYKNHRARGASVYALSERGATSEAARWLAERENQSELMGGVKLSDKGSMLRSVLLDLSQTATTGASLEVGNEVLKQLDNVGKLHHGRVEQAAFVVLKSPDIPSILVETGFVSNLDEERALRDPHYQEAVAQAIAQGVKQYFKRRPPRGTFPSLLKRGVFDYRIRPGENLSMIADRHHTSIQALQRLNQLEKPFIQVGQVIKVPKAKLESF